MISLRIGGVPEHFNLPWHVARERGRFAAADVGVEWRDYPGGSGAMANALRLAELDAALLLTEGAVAGIADGGGYHIVSLYTATPLVWGLHVPAPSKLRSEADLQGARIAISRRGSGSHLMAYVHARRHGWPVEALRFVTVGNLEGAVQAFAAGTADVFFWEKFMTKPLVAAGRFRRVGEFSAPWPAFVVCVADAAGRERRAAVVRALGTALDVARELKSQADGPEVIGARYGLSVADAREWLSQTRWSPRVGIAAEDLTSTCAALNELGVLSRRVEPEECVTP